MPKSSGTPVQWHTKTLAYGHMRSIKNIQILKTLVIFEHLKDIIESRTYMSYFAAEYYYYVLQFDANLPFLAGGPTDTTKRNITT